VLPWTSIASRRGGGSTRLRLWFGYPAGVGRRRYRGETGRCTVYFWNIQIQYLQHTFEDRWNTWNVHLKQLQKHLKTLKTIVKHTQHLDKTPAIYVWNICNIQINTLATYVWKNRWNNRNRSLQHLDLLFNIHMEHLQCTYETSKIVET
jgi:hypothetical protein